MRIRRPAVLLVAFAATLTALLVSSAQGATAAQAPAGGAVPQRPAGGHAPRIGTLVDIRAAHHRGFDRLAFEFRGPLPARREVRYVPRVVSGTSGLPIPVVGNAFLQVTFSPAVGHDEAGRITYGPTRRTFALPNVIQVVNTEDFEAVLGFGVGLVRREPVRVSVAGHLVLVDVATPFRTVAVRDYFVDLPRFQQGQTPYVRPVRRPVIPPAVATGALQRLFAGPTQPELAAGLRFVSSEATGFTALSIRHGIARVRLTGGCASHGSTLTIADEIVPTLKQFASVRWVKIYDPSGHTERPTGPGDSIPECLEP